MESKCEADDGKTPLKPEFILIETVSILIFHYFFAISLATWPELLPALFYCMAVACCVTF